MSGRLSIVSWNVASWATTAANIAKHHGSVSAWLDRHNVDILCLQEVKATKPKLLSLPTSCILNPLHWDVFLSSCVSRPGLNGVATLVRKNRFPGGFPTVGASARPFGIADLDNQGRCILTDHGAFTIINVYAPYDGELGVQLGLKLKFLDALHALILRTQASGRRVICVGDWNVARNARDVHFEFRRIDVDDLVFNIARSLDICESRIGRPLADEVVEILKCLSSQWTSLREILLDTRKIVEVGNNGNQSSRFALKVGRDKLVQIGQRQSSSTACDNIANPNPVITADGLVYKPSGVLAISDLFEAISKLFGKDFSEQARAAFSDVFAKPRACAAVVEKYDKLLSECQLADTYIHSNPAGRPIGCERFTCWDQYRNERYENKGSRIDYIFVDQGLISSVRLSDGEDKSLSSLATSSDRTKALAAVTADGKWKPVPFSGGGIDGDQFFSEPAKQFEFLFSNPPQTGIVYTAPLFSDHVATSCVLDMASLDTHGINDRSNDDLGAAWKSTLSDSQVIAHSHPAKSHSLKDLFSKATAAKAQSAPAALVVEKPSSVVNLGLTTEVISLDDSSPEVKRSRTNID